MGEQNFENIVRLKHNLLSMGLIPLNNKLHL